MKRVLVIAVFLIVFILAWICQRGYTSPMAESLQPARSVMEVFRTKSEELCRARQDEERLLAEKKEKYIADTLKGMSLEEKLSQMMILTNPKDVTAAGISDYQPGGIIYFALDFNGKTIEQVKTRTEELQVAAKYPLIVGVDEEGGEVNRVSGLREKDLPCFQGARVLWKEQNQTMVREDTRVKAAFLKQMGINLNFGPVADVVNKKGAYMYNRSAGDDGETVASYVQTVLETMQEEELASCIKHFPGYGNNVNTHKLYTMDTRKLSEYQESDFLPFQMGIEQGTDMIMVSHIVMQAVDDKNPASLSEEVHKLLRQELGYEGVIISDDLNMKAVLSIMTLEDASGKAVLAGNDMIFSANYHASLKGLQKLVEGGTLTEKQVDESVTRILKLKIERNIIKVDGYR